MNQDNASDKKIKIVLEISLDNSSQQTTSERPNKITTIHASLNDAQQVLLQPVIANQFGDMTINDVLDQLGLMNQLSLTQPSTSTSQQKRERATAPVMAMVRPQIRAAPIAATVRPQPQRDVEQQDDDDNTGVPRPFTAAQRAFFAARRRERERGGGERESVFERIRQFQDHNISIEAVALQAKALLESRRQQRN